MSMKFQVVWDKCNVTLHAGTDKQESRILRRGEYLPQQGLDTFQVDTLLSVGATRAVDDSLPPLPVAAAVAANAPLQVPETSSGADDAGRPAQSAAKAEWVAYAVAQRPEGQSEADARAEAEGKSKADLVAKYGG